MFSCFKAKSEKIFNTRGLFISAIFRVKLIAETRLYMPQKHQIYGFFFYSFSNVFAGDIYKKYSIGNGEWIEFETATITT